MTGSSSKLTVSGNFENLAQIADFIDRAAVQAGFDGRATYGLKMAVDEACTNIIEHGYGGEDRGQICLSYRIEPDGMQVIIYDQGIPFDPEQVPEPDTEAPLAERSPRGMGIFLMRQLVDTVEFKFGTPQGNRLILFKRREQA